MMPEYRRFIAYFYEYINGKKTKNAGFAKVELRNGIWRILFRVTTDFVPDPPVKVFGFVREDGYLLGLPMGTVSAGREITEEWAYQANVPIGQKYCFANLSGIWIQSQDQRIFLTVWDDEEVKVDRFVLKLPEKSQNSENVEQSEAMEKVSQADDTVTTGENNNTIEIEPETLEKQNNRKKEPIVESQETVRNECVKESEVQIQNGTNKKKNCTTDYEMESMFTVRSSFCPFQDHEITSCVMLRPCDIAWLQQKGWQVGRSSFLLHGFYQYRHLLLGKNTSGEYVLGVPGCRTPQDQYMAELFGYEQFKMSRSYEENQIFGYWYRPLTKC